MVPPMSATSILDDDLHERRQQRVEHELARNGLRGLEHAGEVEVLAGSRSRRVPYPAEVPSIGLPDGTASDPKTLLRPERPAIPIRRIEQCV
jgi:hypothetical protein